MDIKSIFAARLLELSEGKTQQEIADATGVSRVTISYYQNGERSPDIVTLSRMATYFDVTSDYLIGLSDAKKAENSDICGFTGLSEYSVSEFWMTKRLSEDHDPLSLSSTTNNFIESLFRHEVFDLLNMLISRMEHLSVDGYTPMPTGHTNPRYNNIEYKIDGKEAVEKQGYVVVNQFEYMAVLRNKLNHTLQRVLDDVLAPYDQKLTQYEIEACAKMDTVRLRPLIESAEQYRREYMEVASTRKANLTAAKKDGDSNGDD